MRSSAVELIAVVFFLGVVFLGFTHTGFFQRVTEYSESVSAIEETVEPEGEVTEMQEMYDEYSYAWTQIEEALR